MILELKLRKVGNSVGVIMPREAPAHLNVGESDAVTMTEGPEGSVRLSPHKAGVARQMELLRDVMKRDRRTLQELAK